MDVINGREIGPEFRESGDPEWFDATLSPGGAQTVDKYVGYGRWRERIYPPSAHIADKNPLVLGRVGLRQALRRLDVTLNPKQEGSPSTHGSPANEDPTALAVVATFDALEWVHSLDDHLRAVRRYDTAANLDSVHGCYVEGAVGARNASHHGLRRVLGIVEVQRPVYEVRGTRWFHTGTYSKTKTDLQVRWVERLPSRADDPTAKNALRFRRQEKAFNEYLSGREVRNTFNSIFAFFFFSVDGKVAPDDLWFGPQINPPPIDPTALRNV